MHNPVLSCFNVLPDEQGHRNLLCGGFGSKNGTQCGMTRPARHSRQHFSISSRNVSGTVVDCTEMASEGATLSASTDARGRSRVGFVWASPPSRKSSAPMLTAIFAASNFASFFLVKIGCVAYERCAPSGLVMVKMHCLPMIDVRGRWKRGDKLTP